MLRSARLKSFKLLRQSSAWCERSRSPLGLCKDRTIIKLSTVIRFSSSVVISCSIQFGNQRFPFDQIQFVGSANWAFRSALVSTRSWLLSIGSFRSKLQTSLISGCLLLVSVAVSNEKRYLKKKINSIDTRSQDEKTRKDLGDWPQLRHIFAKLEKFKLKHSSLRFELRKWSKNETERLICHTKCGH